VPIAATADAEVVKVRFCHCASKLILQQWALIITKFDKKVVISANAHSI